MADWSNPLLTSTYTNFLTEVKARDTDVAVQFNYSGTLGGPALLNTPPNAVGWDASANRWKKYNGTSWAELADPYNLTSVGVTSATVPSNGIYLPATNTVGISTNSTGKVYVDSSGRLLVGQSTTGLQAARSMAWQGSGEGTLYLSHSTSDANNDPYIKFGYNAVETGSLRQVGNTGIGLFSVDYLSFGAGNTERLRITSTGDVNIKGAGTAGSTQAVSFSGSAPVNSLVVQGTTGYVGINNSSPDTFLHSRASTTGVPATTGTTPSNTVARFGSTATTGVLDIGSNSSAPWIQATDRTDLSQKYSLLLNPNGGNVGIGTANPGSLLEVSNGGTASSASGGTLARLIGSGVSRLDIVGGNTSYSILEFSRANLTAAGQITYEHSTNSLYFTTNGATERARIDSSGRLLVGTGTSRSTAIGDPQFQVEGTTYGGSSIQMICNSAADATTCSHLAFGRSKTTSIGGTGQVVNNDRLGAISWNGAQNSTLSSIAGLIECYVDGEVQTAGDTTDMPGRLVFSTTADGASSPTARATINNLGYLTGTVNGLSSGIYPAQQYYRLNAIYGGSNVNTAQSIFGVGVTLVGSTQYEFESVIYLYGIVSTTPTILSFKFGGTATIHNILFMGTGPNITGYDATPVSFLHNTAAGGDVTATMTATASYYVCYVVKGTVSVNAGGTFIPQYQFSAAPGSGWNTGIGSYFSIWPLGASGSNISIGSWA